MSLRLAFVLFLITICIGKSFGTTYYIKAAGNDNLDGTTIATAWKTLEAVRKKNFGAGDIILLEGGTVFNGYLFFNKEDMGNPANPITITSYGTGKATINSGDNYGLYLYNTSAFKISNIILKGSGPSINSDSGIKFLNDQASTRLDYVFVDNLEVTGYGKSGILIEGRNYNAGFKNISIINNNIHDDGESGINVMGDSLNLITVYAHQNVYVANNKVYNIKGISNAYNVTGNGILISSSNGVTIEYNEANNNGELSNSPIGGPIGIWVFDANNVLMQYNESHHNKTGGILDGGGFDLDGGTTNSIVQYNYSHDNDGTGYLLAIHKNKNRLKGNTFRYNISQNDGRKNEYSSVYFWAHDASTGIEDLQFYNNTIYQSPPLSGNPTVLRIVGPMSNVSFRNNIFYSTEWIYQIASTESNGITFQGNCYYSSGSFNIWWNGIVYTSLNSWRTATGQEKIGATNTGIQTDPQLNSPGTGGTISNTHLLATVTQYQLQSTSPLLNTGLDLSQFGINAGARDYFGYSIKQGAQFDIGAHESGVTGTNNDITVNLTSPVAGSTITTGSSLDLTAHATSGNATISKIEFYRGATLLGTSTSWPYKITLSNLSAGSYSVTAKAFNSTGASTSSSAITFNVSTPVIPTLRNPDNPDNTINGIDYAYYEGTWTILPDFNTLTPVKTGTTTNYSLSNRNRDDNFAFKFTSYIHVPADGTYTFYTSSNEGSKLYIGNTELVNNDGIHSAIEKSGAIGLKAGKHSITVTYFEATGSEALTISYSGPDISKTSIPASSLFRVSETTLTCNATGKIFREVWNNIAGNSVINLTNNSNYPNNPSSSSLLTVFEGPLNVGDNYGARYRGYLCAPTTGNYTFWISSDNDSELWLSTNQDSVNKIKIAYTEGYTESREWEKYPTQKSTTIFLNKGRYYVEALHKEGIGEDNLAVGWQLPDGSMERPIPGSRLTAFGESINNPPAVVITSPTNNASFLAPANITISTNASDPDGSITKVEFYQGQTLLGTDTNSPYAFNWTNVASGNYALTAKAFDNNNTTTTSTIINIQVNNPPTASISSPTNNTSFLAPANIIINANASDADGNITKVEFYQGQTLLGTDTNSPYSYNWTNVAAGNYALTAKAFDNNNATTTSAIVNIQVSNNTPPTVSISSPSNNASFLAPANIPITATASDTDGSITKVEFYQGQTLLGTVTNSPYSYNWTNVTAGNYALTAKAFDNNGAITTSTIINIQVNNPPTVSISSPANNTSFLAPATITINANASDTDGSISKVEFYQGLTLLGTDTNSPYSYIWTNVAAGNYALTAKAFDNNNATTTSAIVNIQVSNNTPPTVSISSPSNNASFLAPANFLITATASDTDGSISKVEFYQGLTLLGTDTNSPYSFNWSNVAAGNYALTAKAYDNNGAITSSTIINIQVNNPPTVIISSPANNTSFLAPASITIEANASDTDGSISKVEFYQGLTLLGTDTNSPYSYIWTNVTAGNYALTAKAFDNNNAITTSAIVNIQVSNNTPPTVSISSPSNNASFLAPANITIDASASDTDGSISKVEFYQGLTLLGTDTNSPYSFNWTNVASGNYDLTAKAFDNNEATTTSAIINIQVSNNTPPTVSISSPSNNASFLAPANITIDATASDTDGSITKVEFYQGLTLLGTDINSPYSFSWTNVIAGNYTLTAKAFDNIGASNTSNPVTIEVTNGSGCTASGSILREFWSGALGNSVSNIPINNLPTNTSELSIFEGPSNAGINYGARYRGYLCVPITGNYTFWIASNDNSELWLSTDDNPNNKVRIAYISSYTNERQWDKMPSQKSATINLVVGKKYYIEALHKQGAGTDHLAVGWQLPNGTLERPISGSRLSPFGKGNSSPSISITNPTNGTVYTAPALISITANASDIDGNISKVEFYQNNSLLETVTQSPYSFTWTNVVEGNYTLTARAFDNGGLQTISSPINISVIAGGSNCSAGGTVLREFWSGVSGNSVSQIPINTTPTSTSNLTLFEGPTNVADNYGARYRGYICAPITGAYTFWIASNDNGELWLSTDDNPANKVRIAYVASYTNVRQWDKSPQQKSASINLIAGKKYYIEALHKEGLNSDNLAVGWQLPNGIQERPIPGNRLTPNVPASPAKESVLEGDSDSYITIYPNPTNEKLWLNIKNQTFKEEKSQLLHVEIYDITGRSFYHSDWNINGINVIELDISGFSNGLYLIKTEFNNTSNYQKFIKE